MPRIIQSINITFLPASCVTSDVMDNIIREVGLFNNGYKFCLDYDRVEMGRQSGNAVRENTDVAMQSFCSSFNRHK